MCSDLTTGALLPPSPLCYSNMLGIPLYMLLLDGMSVKPAIAVHPRSRNWGDSLRDCRKDFISPSTRIVLAVKHELAELLEVIWNGSVLSPECDLSRHIPQPQPCFTIHGICTKHVQPFACCAIGKHRRAHYAMLYL